MAGAQVRQIATTSGHVEVETWPTANGALHRAVVTGGSTEDVADALTAECPAGTALLVDREDLMLALRDRGSTMVRHLHAMRHRLIAMPDSDVPGTFTLRPWRSGDGDALAAAYLDAYGPGHPDARSGGLADAALELTRMAEDPDNPRIAEACAVLDVDGEPVGCALVLRSAYFRGFAGPWLMNVFRSPGPRAKGAGEVLVIAAMHALHEAGEGGLGLAVTHANTGARAVYERLGFEYALQGWVVVTA